MRCSFQVVKVTLTKLNSYLTNPNTSKRLRQSFIVDPGPLSAIRKLYNETLEFLNYLIHDPTMDHMEVRFGREVIFNVDELNSSNLLLEPRKVSIEELLPMARPRGLSDSMVLHASLEKDGFPRMERL